MLFFLAIAAVIAWTIVVSLALLINIRLFLKTIRWAITMLMVVLGVPLIYVLREGLVVVQYQLDEVSDEELVNYATSRWTVWYLFATSSIFFWPFLIPAVGGMVAALSQPEVLQLLDYGLVRLGWSDYVHNPLWHMAVGAWQLWIILGEKFQEFYDERFGQEALGEY
ncbi:hypothetical protein F5Y02DRAFT_87951 [Annulohypoxylon stygium]|nr:hypothetical protein F5Y02DRAFT_87951 [Annulohypoxylon stygium]